MKNSNILLKRTILAVRNYRLALSLAIILLSAAGVNGQNVVVQWNAIASTTIVTNHAEAFVASGV